MSSPNRKRQKLEDDVVSVTDMSNESIIDENAQTFKYIASLDGFVDRTMLLEELLNHKPAYVMIFAPSKFGKTVNLDMIAFICDIENKNGKTKEDIAKNPTMKELRSNPSENMKVLLRQFNNKQYDECLILKNEEFVIQHFGRHPVIFFDFKECTPTNESETIRDCAELVRESYLENRYLKTSEELKSDDDELKRLKRKCEKWCSYDDDDLKKLSKLDVIKGLKDLIKSLKIHWGRDPVFLVDEIDKPCVAAITKKLSIDQIQEIGNVVSDVVCSVLKQRENQLIKLEAALVTGISKFRNTELSSFDNAVKTYFLGDARFSKYYGLTTKEVDCLVRKFFASEGDDKITEIISNINTSYNGYYQRSSSGQKPIEYARYCLFSVLSYIKQKNEDKDNPNMSFWNGGGGLMGNLVSVFNKSNVIMNDVETLLYNDSGTIQITYQKEVDAKNLVGFYCEKNAPNRDASFNFFLQRGFLAHNLEKPEETVEGEVKIHVRIPNLEIKGMYRAMFKDYHASTLSNNVISSFTSCGRFFKSLAIKLESFMENSEKFEDDLKELCTNLTHIFSSCNCQSEATICSYLVTMLKLYAEYEKSEKDYTVQYLDNGKRSYVNIDVWGKHGDFALILEVKYNVDANGESGKIGNTKKSSLAAAEDIVILLPDKKNAEDGNCRKAGTGRNLEVLKSSKIKNYLLMGLAVDGDGTTHMLVFPNSTDWKNVIQVNPENHVAELISTHLKSKISVV